VSVLVTHQIDGEAREHHPVDVDLLGEERDERDPDVRLVDTREDRCAIRLGQRGLPDAHPDLREEGQGDLAVDGECTAGLLLHPLDDHGLVRVGIEGGREVGAHRQHDQDENADRKPDPLDRFHIPSGITGLWYSPGNGAACGPVIVVL
jgi:hypothetical protein